jgi:hypothetical protein
VPRKLMTMHGDQRHSVIVDNTRRSIHTWQDGGRNPSLTALLVLEFCAIFLARLVRTLEGWGMPDRIVCI